jgi:MinD-like ATPase involved in chromosome partitioning or flagellar assembly
MVRILKTKISINDIERNVFLRDPSGQLTFVVIEDDIDRSVLDELIATITAELVPYVDGDGFAISTPAELFDDTLKVSTAFRLSLVVDDSEMRLNMIDRRIIGSDWLQTPIDRGSVPRIVFASLKGGVGRSTALCVAASALASAGQRVLAIDMDVEAPGLGSMLLTKETSPALGLLDYLVEANFGRSAEELLDILIAPSWLSDGVGVIDVIPALGARALAAPQNVLSKVSRAYVSHDAASQGVTTRMQTLINAAENSLRYDVIVVDARAGLHETTGAALLGLGAKLLVFGTDQPQTFEAFRLLFANLSMVAAGGLDGNISVVHAKSTSNIDSRNAFAMQMRELVTEEMYGRRDEGVKPSVTGMTFDVDWETDESVLIEIVDDFLSVEDRAPRVVHIGESELFRDFDPLDRPETLTHHTYAAVYGEFISHVFRLANVPSLGDADD